MTDAPSIALHGLTKHYGTRRGIEDVSLTVAPGEVFGFLGPNGAGKTTTIRTMLDLLRPSAGRATLLGLDSHDDAVEIHRSVGYLPGDFVAYRRMTGRRYLEFFAEVRDVPFGTVEALSRRFACDLEPQIASLSHGNAQKLGLIQALMHRPRLLILDEPTQGLDPLIQRVFHQLMREIAAEGRTVFLSSHVLPEVERMCDRVGIIGEGRLLGVEDVGDLRAKAIRVLEFHFATQVPATVFADLPGVSGLEVHGNRSAARSAAPSTACSRRLPGMKSSTSGAMNRVSRSCSSSTTQPSRRHRDRPRAEGAPRSAAGADRLGDRPDWHGPDVQLLLAQRARQRRSIRDLPGEHPRCAPERDR